MNNEDAYKILAVYIVTYAYLLLLCVLLVSIYVCGNTYYLFVSLVVSDIGFEDEAVVLFAPVPGNCTIVKGLSNLKPFRIKRILKRILLKDETKNI